MKDSHEAIDRVLTGLRDVSAPVGMEQRVLAAMERRTAERTGWQWRTWSVGLAAVVVLLAAGVVSVRPHRSYPEAVAVVAQPPVLPGPAPVAETRQRNTGIRTVAQNDRGHKVFPTRETVLQEETTSIPAPPMPLTEQERLLLQLAHRADATELTPLNAEARAKQNAAFDEEFQEFFATSGTASANTNSNEKEKGDTQ